MNEEKDEALKADESQIEVESPTTEVLPVESEVETVEPQSTDEVVAEAPTEEKTERKTANSRIRELVAEKKEAVSEAEKEKLRADSLEEMISGIKTPQVPQYQPTQDPANSEEVTVDEVLRKADAITQIRLAQRDNAYRLVDEIQQSVKNYPELDKDSDSFDPDLSDSISKATKKLIDANPTISVKEFVDNMMKPYKRSLDKQAAGQKETITKQVSEQAMRPTQVQEQEKPFSELSIAEMEKKLGVVHR